MSAVESAAAVVIDAKVVPALDRPAAERLDRRIRLMVDAVNKNVEKLEDLVDEAKRGDIHSALGYASWTAYLSDVFTVQVRLDRDRRRELVGYLAGEGMSQRAIADVVGISKNTVTADLSQFGTPQADSVDVEVDEDALAEELIAAELSGVHVADEPTAIKTEPAPAPVIGLDGKKYQSPRRKPLTDEARAIGLELSKTTKRIQKLLADDRLSQNREQVGCAIRPWPTHALTALHQLNNEIGPSWPGPVLNHIVETLAAVVVSCNFPDLEQVEQSVVNQHVAAIRDHLDTIHEQWSAR